MFGFWKENREKNHKKRKNEQKIYKCFSCLDVEEKVDAKQIKLLRNTIFPSFPHLLFKETGRKIL